MAIGAGRTYHCNSNCTDLEASARFYEALGLRRVLRTTPSAPQPGAGFGLAEVAWDAWILQSDDGADGLSLDLLRWTTPPPTGTPPPTVAEPGLNRLVVLTPDIDGVVAAARDAGGEVRCPPVAGHAVEGAPRTAMLADPDGVAVQVLEGDRTSIAQVIVNVTDVERSLAYYRDVTGLHPAGDPRTVDQPGALHGLGDARAEVLTVESE